MSDASPGIPEAPAGTTEPATERVLAVDLDETLLTVNTFPRLAKFLPRVLLRSGDVLGAVRLVVAVIRRKALRGDHVSFKREVIRATERADPGVIDAWAQQVYRDYLDPKVSAIVQDWDGPVILTSACPEPLAVRMAALAGCREGHGSRTHHGTFFNNYGPGKVARLKEAGFTQVALAITDDAVADRELLQFAERALVVTPARELVEWTGSGPAAPLAG